MRPVSVGLIGAGFHARSVHIPCLDLAPQLRLAAIATSREQTARDAAQRYRVNAYCSYAELLDKADVEAVIVAVPSSMFDAVCKRAVERGKHVFVESPGIGTREGAREIQALAARKKLTVQVGFSLRYAPPFELLKQYSDRAKGSRLFMYEYYPFLSHIYNLALYLSGPLRRVVSAVRQPAGSTAVLQFENNDTAVVLGRSVANCGISLERVTVSTTEFYGAVEQRNRVRIVEHMKSTPVEDWSVANSGGISYEPHVFCTDVLHNSGYVAQLAAFALAIREGQPPRSTLSDALETRLIEEAIQQQSLVAG